MTDAELADEIEQGEIAISTLYEGEFVRDMDKAREIIAALRRADPVLGECEECGHTIVSPLKRLPERQPSSDQVLVPREPTKEILAAMVVANVEHDKLCESVGWDGVRRSERIYHAMLSAAEAEGKKA